MRSSTARLLSAVAVAALLVGAPPAAAKPSPGKSAAGSAAKHPSTQHSSSTSKSPASRTSSGAPVQIVCTSAPQTGSPTNGTPWPQQRLNFRRAWPISTGAGVKVAVIDSGIDRSQPQLAKIHIAAPHNVIDGSSYVQDCVGHGSAVTGIIAAPPMPGTDFFGVAPGATIIPVRQTDANGKGTDTGIAAGIDWAVQHGARVINISGGTATPSTAIEQSIVRADAHGVVIVAAAGNDGQASGVRAKLYPAAYATTHTNVLAVAAVDSTDTYAPFSELGGYTTLCAPGVDVVAPTLRSGYKSDQGTSFAAPFVTGTVALMLGADPGLTPAQIRDRLTATADAPPKTVPDPQYGYGVVNPYRAVTAITGTAASPAAQSLAPLPPVAASQPRDRSLQHLALGLSAALVLLAGFLLGGWSLARRRRAALHAIRSAEPEPVRR